MSLGPGQLPSKSSRASMDIGVVTSVLLSCIMLIACSWDVSGMQRPTGREASSARRALIALGSVELKMARARSYSGAGTPAQLAANAAAAAGIAAVTQRRDRARAAATSPPKKGSSLFQAATLVTQSGGMGTGEKGSVRSRTRTRATASGTQSRDRPSGPPGRSEQLFAIDSSNSCRSDKLLPVLKSVRSAELAFAVEYAHVANAARCLDTMKATPLSTDAYRHIAARG